MVTAAWQWLRHCERLRAEGTLGAFANPGSRLQNLKTGWRRPPAAPAAEAAEAGCQMPQSHGRHSAPGVLPARQGPQILATLLAALLGGPARGTHQTVSATCAGPPRGMQPRHYLCARSSTHLGRRRHSCYAAHVLRRPF